MGFSQWFRSRYPTRRRSAAARTRQRVPARRSHKLHVEPLEYRIVLSGPGDIEWLREFGSTDFEPAGANIRAVDADGNVYVVGETEGTFPGHTNAGG